jgi:hypothetical protein
MDGQQNLLQDVLMLVMRQSLTPPPDDGAQGWGHGWVKVD